jgi:hypothetical protein
MNYRPPFFYLYVTFVLRKCISQSKLPDQHILLQNTKQTLLRRNLKSLQLIETKIFKNLALSYHYP